MCLAGDLWQTDSPVTPCHSRRFPWTKMSTFGNIYGECFGVLEYSCPYYANHDILLQVGIVCIVYSVHEMVMGRSVLVHPPHEQAQISYTPPRPPRGPCTQNGWSMPAELDSGSLPGSLSATRQTAACRALWALHA